MKLHELKAEFFTRLPVRRTAWPQEIRIMAVPDPAAWMMTQYAPGAVMMDGHMTAPYTITVEDFAADDWELFQEQPPPVPEDEVRALREYWEKEVVDHREPWGGFTIIREWFKRIF